MSLETDLTALLAQANALSREDRRYRNLVAMVANIRQALGSESSTSPGPIVDAITNGNAALTANQVLILAELAKLLVAGVSTPISAIGASGNSLSLEIPPPPAGRFNILTELVVGYSGSGTIPAAGGALTVDWGNGDPRPYTTLTTPGPAPLLSAEQTAVVAGNSAGTAGRIIISLAGLSNLVGQIKAAYRVSS